MPAVVSVLNNVGSPETGLKWIWPAGLVCLGKKGYSKVDIVQFDYPFEQFLDATPIGIEIMEGAEMMTTFDHPKNAVYIFGPEDGGLPKIARSYCHRFIFIPMQHCANLAAAVYITLYDRSRETHESLRCLG